MYLTILNDDGSQKRYRVARENFADKHLKNHLGYIHSRSKEYTALEILKAYYSDSRAILLDSSNRILLEKLKTMHIGEFSDSRQKKNPLDQADFLMLFFTSGSTGYPVGALKSRDNLDKESRALTKLLEKYKIDKVVVTVPFIHIYGTLFGLLYPLMNDIDIVLKEHFLPNDLLEFVNGHTLVVTTPLYIKALTKLDRNKRLNNSLFVSSTAPLDSRVAQRFLTKFDTNMIQIFGSTETGGIAYKTNMETLWTPMEGVKISSNEANELIVESPFVSTQLYEEGLHRTCGKMETFDYVEIENNQFKLLGRSSKILKIAGKRYSTIQIENSLEEIEGISKALVSVERAPDSLRGELLNITLESDRDFSVREIKKIIQNSFSNLKFSIKLTRKDSIPTSEMGKKLFI